MTNVLVYVETNGSAATDLSVELLLGAQTLIDGSGTVTALIVSDDQNGQAAQSLPVDKVIIANDGNDANGYTAQRHVVALLETFNKTAPDVVLIPNSYIGIELGAWIAAKTDRPYLTYCHAVAKKGGEVVATCQGYEGKLLAEINAPMPAIMGMNSGAFGKMQPQSGAPSVESLDFSSPSFAVVLSRNVADTGGTDITMSEKLVSIGRGIGDEDNIEQVEELAALLNAEMSASRPLIDQGWVEKNRQVGKSGRTVLPKLYLAMGISGAPEHLEGMRDAELIIAVNTDASAPIFDVAHYGTSCDLLDFIVELTDLLEG